MTIVQTGRYNEILDKRGAQGVLCGMSSDFMKTVFEAIHEESVHQQIEVMNKIDRERGGWLSSRLLSKNGI